MSKTYYEFVSKRFPENNTLASSKGFTVQTAEEWCREWDKVRRKINKNACRCEMEEF